MISRTMLVLGAQPLLIGYYKAITMIINTHTKSQGEASQEPETPRANDEQTRTLSPVVSMENTFLDKKLSICSIAVELREIHVDSCIFDDFDLMDNHGS